MNLDFYKGKKILITGARGYIGSALCRQLFDVPCNLILQIHHGPYQVPRKTAAKITVTKGDIAAPGVWQKLLPGVEVLFHLAEHHYKTFDPVQDLAITAAPVLSLLEVCRQEKRQPKIVFSSSSNLVGLAAHLPVNEDVPDHPLTIYAIHKLLAEKYLEYYAREYDIPSVTLRLANVYGPVTEKDTTIRAVLNYMVATALEKREITLFRNRQRLRDYVYITDVVAAFLAAGAAAEAKKGEYYLIGSGEKLTIEEAAKRFAAEIAAVTGWAPVIKVDNENPVSLVEQRDFVADSRRFQALTGWAPQVSFREGIKRTVEYLCPTNKS